MVSRAEIVAEVQRRLLGRKYTEQLRVILEQAIVAAFAEMDRIPCGGCPHPEHKEPCTIFVSELDKPCGCGYDVEEDGTDLPEGGYDLWIKHQTFPTIS